MLGSGRYTDSHSDGKKNQEAASKEADAKAKSGPPRFINKKRDTKAPETTVSSTNQGENLGVKEKTPIKEFIPIPEQENKKKSNEKQPKVEKPEKKEEKSEKAVGKPSERVEKGADKPSDRNPEKSERKEKDNKKSSPPREQQSRDVEKSTNPEQKEKAGKQEGATSQTQDASKKSEKPVENSEEAQKNSKPVNDDKASLALSLKNKKMSEKSMKLNSSSFFAGAKPEPSGGASEIKPQASANTSNEPVIEPPATVNKEPREDNAASGANPSQASLKKESSDSFKLGAGDAHLSIK